MAARNLPARVNIHVLWRYMY